MTGKIVGYIRVSSVDQNIDRQLEGIKLDKKFIDKASGKSRKREALEEMLNYVREGDQIMVHSMDRLARNLDDLRCLVKQFTSKQVKVKFIQESLEFTGDDSAISKLLLSVMGSVAEFERSLIKERQLEGVALAKKRGVYKGRKKSLSEDQIKLLKEAAQNGIPKTQIAEYLNINRSTVYQYLNDNSC